MIVRHAHRAANPFSKPGQRRARGRMLGEALAALACVIASASAADFSECTTPDCLLRAIPRDQKPSIPMDDCKVLDEIREKQMG